LFRDETPPLAMHDRVETGPGPGLPAPVRRYDISADFEGYFERHAVLAPPALPSILHAPVQMTPSERIFLWTLTYGTRPATYLEIGSFAGGSALLVASALDTLGAPGRMALIEPAPCIATETWEKLAPRATLLRRSSPLAIPEAVAALGGPVELALVDGDHRAAGVRADGEAVLAVLARNAYLLFHDAFHREVERAIDGLLAAHPTLLVDCGIITREVTSHRRIPALRPESGWRRLAGRAAAGFRRRATWGGLRMLRRL
jgi:predicted O-methyltransferase YrrM